MNDSTLRQRLRAGDPAPSAPQYSHAEASRLLSEITSASTNNVMSLRKPRAFKLAVAAAVAAAVVVAPTLTLNGAAPVSQAAAAALNAAAILVQDDPQWTPGQFWKITTLEHQGKLGSSEHIKYVPVDGIGLSYYSSGAVGNPSDFWRGEDMSKSDEGWWQMPSSAFLASLPRDTAALRDRLYTDVVGHGTTLDGEAYVYVTDLFRSGVVPSDLQVALLRVLATVPGVEITSDSVTLDGRAGLGIGCVEPKGDGESVTEIVLDTKTGQIIGERHLWNGAVRYTTSSTRELVDAVPAEYITKSN